MLTRHTGREADRGALGEWRWLGRVVKVFDGSTVSMPDTPENQEAFPQSRRQAPGVGFPLARLGVLFSLAVGTVLELGIRRWAGKFQSELAMLRDMIPSLQKGEVLLTDRYLCSHMEIALLQQRGVDFVGQMHARRKVDFRRGRRLGPCDHVVEWSKPPKPDGMSAEDYAAIPQTLAFREFRCRIVRRGDRARTIVVATTLLDAQRYPRDQIAQAAARHGKDPRQISFTRAMRTLEAFRPVIAHVPREQLAALYEHMLTAIASHAIGHRPDRLEPRQRQRRPKPYQLMTKPRNQARKQEAKTR